MKKVYTVLISSFASLSLYGYTQIAYVHNMTKHPVKITVTLSTGQEHLLNIKAGATGSLTSSECFKIFTVTGLEGDINNKFDLIKVPKFDRCNTNLDVNITSQDGKVSLDVNPR